MVRHAKKKITKKMATKKAELGVAKPISSVAKPAKRTYKRKDPLAYTNILEEVKKIEHYQELVDKLAKEVENFKTEDFVLTKKSVSLEPAKGADFPLDCKDLTNNKLSRLFNKNFQYLWKIMRGEVPSQRHNLYKSNNIQDSNKLQSSTVHLIFTYKQVEHLINLMKKYFEGKNENKTKYFFEVLLHEIGVQIFMEVHGMTKEETEDYWDKKPVD